MSTTTTAFRGTPSFTVAPTQNTAPVFEFRCLYTHDLRKKKKIWHDGSLRFHTFNRRFMVYDDSKNYIGDAHWRETGDFQEGEELKLDKGVLVEVGEQIGHTETDLAPIILEKRRPENAGSPPRAPPSNVYLSTFRPPATTSQIRPKSLAVVLGASQGPIGRAQAPVRSPFEQRQDRIRQEPEFIGDRPRKKPRMVGEKENVVYNFNPVMQIHSAISRPPAKSQARRERVSPSRQTHTIPGRLEDGPADLLLRPYIQSSQLASRPPALVQREVSSAAGNERPSSLLNGPLTNKLAREPVKRNDFIVAAPRQTSKQRSPEHPLAAEIRVTADAQAFAEDAVASAPVSAGRITNKLRFATEKPRKKLMYKNLLPNGKGENISRTRRRSRDAQGPGWEKERRPSNTSKKDPPPAALIVNLVSEGEGASAIGAQTPTPERGARTPRKTPKRSNAAAANSRSPSPLFVESSAHLQSLPASQDALEADFEPPAQSIVTNQGTGACRRVGLLKEAYEGSLMENTEADDMLGANGEVTKAKTIPEGPSKLTLLDQQLLGTSRVMQLPRPQTRPDIPLYQRPFRRILSETDAQYEQSEGLSSRLSIRDTAEVNAPRAQKVTDRTRQPSESPSKIQRSVSDTTHLAGRTQGQQGCANVGTAVEAGFDPWSEPEAYLLFDWWPPGKDKPSFVVDE